MSRVPITIILLCMAAVRCTTNVPPPGPSVGSLPYLQTVAPGVHLVVGSFVEGRQPDGNSVVLEGREGLVIVDTGRHEAHTRRLLDVAARLEQPIVAIINTHWHLDHVGGNALLRESIPGVRVYATPAINEALGGFLANYERQIIEILPSIEDQAARVRLEKELDLIRSGAALAPTDPIVESQTVEIAGRELSLMVVPYAVTAADLWIVDRASGVVVAGDLVTLPVPFLDTACASGWIASLDTISAAGPVVLIPGHGPVMDGTQLERYRMGLQHLVDCGGRGESESVCADGWIEDLGDLIAESDEPFARRLLDYYVAHHLRTQDPTLCAE